MLYAFLFPLTITTLFAATWVRDWRLYREDFRAAALASAVAAWKAGTRAFILSAVVMVVLTILITPFLLTVLSISELAFLLCSIGSIAFSTVTWTMHPPALLILGSLHSTDPRLLARRLRHAVRGNGVIYFLPLYSRQNRYEGGIDQLDRFYLGATETRFVRTEDDWRRIVYPLLNLVPVIAIDATLLTQSLEEEVERIGKSFALSMKSVVLLNSTQHSEVHSLAKFALRTFSVDQLTQGVAMKFAEWSRNDVRPRQ